MEWTIVKWPLILKIRNPFQNENEPCFLGRVVPSPALEDAFPGAGGKLQYLAPVVGAGYICSRPWKKKRGVPGNHFCSSGLFYTQQSNY